MASVWNEYQPTRAELEYRAERAEEQAARELRSLLRVLDLDEEQQDRVFAALVRRAEYYHPSLQVARADGTLVEPRLAATPTDVGSSVGFREASGAGGADVGRLESAPEPDLAGQESLRGDDPVRAELPPALVDVYERYTSEREAFWVGIVEDIEAELNAP